MTQQNQNGRAENSNSSQKEISENIPKRPKIDPTVRPHKIRENIAQLNNNPSANYYSLPFWKNKIIYILAILFICGLAFIYWSVNRPETTIINDGNINPVQNTKSQASLMFYQGKVYHQENDNSWDNINSSISLHENDSIKTMADSWAMIQFKNGALCRLDANTEIKIIKVSDEEIIIEQVYGQVYHFSNKNEKTISYTVKIQENEFTALSESFNIFNNRQSINSQIFSDSIQIRRHNASKIIKAPTLITINLISDEIQESEISADKEILNYDWLNWNNQQNKLQGLNLMDIPLNENWPSEMTLEAKVIEESIIEFTWKYEDGYEGEPPYGFYLMIDDEEDPSYPKNSYTHIKSDIEESKTTWENLAEGKYNFRAGIFDGEKEIIFYSNNVEIDLSKEQKADITLLGEIENNNAILTWTADNVSSEDNWKIIIAENQAPSYPLNTNQDVDISANSYTWNNLAANKTYQIRLCEYIAETDECRSYSNVIFLSTAIEEEEPTNLIPLSLSTELNNNEINISWSELAISEKYLLSISRAFGETENIEISSNLNNYTFQDAIPGKSYFISLCRVNNNLACLERSNEAKVTIPE